jgi:nucleoside-diphosphate-sugar epimerase
LKERQLAEGDAGARYLVTGSAGHLGEALVRTLRDAGRQVEGLDLVESPYTTHVGSIADAGLSRRAMRGVDVVLHAATLHKPHVATHSRQAFVETNVAGTLTLLEAALAGGASSFVFTSTTSAFGAALKPAAGHPAAWITEDVPAVPKNIYGVTKGAAEDLCELFHRSRGLPVVVLRVARFFPEPDDDRGRRERYDDLNLKVNEYLHRRLDLADAVSAHLLAGERAPEIGFGRYILSATTPFAPEHLEPLRSAAPEVVAELFPEYAAEFGRRGWTMLPAIDRVYVNRRAREELGWSPRYDFGVVLDRLRRDESPFSSLALAVGSKGYHAQEFAGGPYPVEAGE